MKSETMQSTVDQTNRHNNKTFDYVGFYKSSAETNNLLEKSKSCGDINQDISDNTKTKQLIPKRGHSAIIPTSNLPAGNNTPIGFEVTSTPNASSKNKSQTTKIKPIIKNVNLNADETLDSSSHEISIGNSKKRNKSVSFMLDDNEEVITKKTKCDESPKVKKNPNKIKNNKKTKQKLTSVSPSEKENKVSEEENSQITKNDKKHRSKHSKNDKSQEVLNEAANNLSETQNINPEKKKKVNRKKDKCSVSTKTSEIDNNPINQEENVKRKLKKIKNKNLSKPKIDVSETEEEPAAKSRKKDIKPDVVAEDLENLSIGDNAHTLSSLLDEMAVVDKERRKKMKGKNIKHKKQATVNTETAKGDKNEDGEEGENKWKRRKWNKDKKGLLNEESVNTSVIVEGLPVTILLNYRKLLNEHFVKYGLIKSIGIAELYPSAGSKPVFTTTVNFYSDGAAKMALQDDGLPFHGGCISVKRRLPPTDTTLVVYSYATLNDHNISSVFCGAGNIRNIRHLIKGKKAKGTAFIEFDGPESVNQAIEIAKNVKIDGKKIHVTKFQTRNSSKDKVDMKSSNNEDDEDNK